MRAASDPLKRDVKKGRSNQGLPCRPVVKTLFFTAGGTGSIHGQEIKISLLRFTIAFTSAAQLSFDDLSIRIVRNVMSVALKAKTN